MHLNKTIAVVIPCRNEVNNICECIEAIINQKQIDSSLVSIFLVDANSNDGGPELVKEKYGDRVKVLLNPNLYAPYAFNLGIQNSSSEYVVIVGARNIISETYFYECIIVLENDPNIGCVGGATYNVFGDFISEGISNAMNSKIGVGFSNFRTIRKSGYVDTVGTPVFRRSVFEVVGLYDVSLIRNQDDDFSYRILKAGFKIWLNANVNMKYYVRTSLRNLFIQYFQYGYWKIWVNKKHKSITTFRQIIPALFVLFLFIGFPMLSIFNFGFVYFGTLATYMILVFCSSVMISNGLKSALASMSAVVLLHVSYGLGYINGLISVVILGKRPTELSKQLSR